MSRERFKALLPIITAYVNGDTIEHQVSDGRWYEIADSPSWCDPADRYRIKPKPKYRPFASVEEFKPHRDKWFVANNGERIRATRYSSDRVFVSGLGDFRYIDLMRECKFEDGTPCGVLVDDATS